MDEWLETSVRGKRRPATVKSYEDTVRRFLRLAIRRVPLVKLEARHIEQMLAQLPPTCQTRRGATATWCCGSRSVCSTLARSHQEIPV